MDQRQRAFRPWRDGRRRRQRHALLLTSRLLLTDYRAVAIDFATTRAC